MAETTLKHSTDITEPVPFHRGLGVDQLLHDTVERSRNAEYLTNPESRLALLESLDADDFMHMAAYANAKLRGEKYHELHQRNEKGGHLPGGLHVPSKEDKSAAFQRGFDAIQEYLAESNDSVQDKLNKVAMGAEALIVWVHPFNDGNGRTSRFIAKLLEDGTADRAELAVETVSNDYRGMWYGAAVKLKTKQSVLEEAEEARHDEDRSRLTEQASTLPNDVEGMYLSVQNLLYSETTQEEARRYRDAGRTALAQLRAAAIDRRSASKSVEE